MKMRAQRFGMAYDEEELKQRASGFATAVGASVRSLADIDGAEDTVPSVGTRFKVGDDVQYWSNTHEQWLPAMVKRVRVNGFYDLNIKKKANVQNMRSAAQLALVSKWPSPAATMSVASPTGSYSAPSQHVGIEFEQIMTNPLKRIFQFLKDRSRVQVWLHDHSDLRIEGRIRGYDEYMNLVMDAGEEISVRKKTRHAIGDRILLRGDSICLIMSLGCAIWFPWEYALGCLV